MGTGTLAFIIFIFVLVQVALLMGIGIFRRKRKYRDLESLTSESQVTGTANEKCARFIWYRPMVSHSLHSSRASS
jgi:hypothetical protein